MINIQLIHRECWWCMKKYRLYVITKYITYFTSKKTELEG